MLAAQMPQYNETEWNKGHKVAYKAVDHVSPHVGVTTHTDAALKSSSNCPLDVNEA